MIKKRIGITCSTFDLFHAGHVIMLEEAKRQCDYLIAAIQTDPTLDRPGTKNRPVQSIVERQIQLAACRYVDEVVVYQTEQDLVDLLLILPIDVRVLGVEYQDKYFTGANEGFAIVGPSVAFEVKNNGNVYVIGALSKGSGSFRIKHPLATKKKTHQLFHSFIEGPQADLIYSGGVTLVDGKATINIDEAATMTEGTFEALNRNIRVFTSNETSWDNVRGKVVGNILTIECQNTESIDEISWMVIGERQDEHIMDTEWTDENGKVIVEPLKTE
jgi:glycerol-3-phosphate cytidylyltransferase